MREITYTDENSIEDINLLLETEGGCAVFNLPEEQYFAFPAFGSSQLMDMLVCPRFFWHGTHWCPENERRELPVSPALEFGSQMHKYLLEPGEFYREYKKEPSTEGTLMTISDLMDFGQTKGVQLPKGNKKELEEVVLQRWPDAPVWSAIKAKYEQDLEAGNIKRITDAQMEKVERMAEALKREVFYIGDTEVPLSHVFRKGEAEKTFIWRHKPTGLDIKCRVDWLLANVIFEYRTAVSASKRAFQRACINRNYHIRAGFYWKVVQEVTGQNLNYYYIAQEKEMPYLNSVNEHAKDHLASGWAVAEKCLNKIAECLAKGDPSDRRNWESYNGNKVALLDLPDWAYEQPQNEEE